jgi:hypothetical protein
MFYLNPLNNRVSYTNYLTSGMEQQVGWFLITILKSFIY